MFAGSHRLTMPADHFNRKTAFWLAGVLLHANLAPFNRVFAIFEITCSAFKNRQERLVC